MKRNGISLIVLVITIVVIIVLAAAVILSLGESNPINNAKKAKEINNIDTFKSDLSLQVATKLLDNPLISVTDIDSKEEDGWRITDLVPSIKGTEYEDDFKVEDGKLVLNEDSTLPEQTKDIVKEALGEKNEEIDENVITSDKVETEKNEEGISKYIGAEVIYKGYDEEKVDQTIKWRIFNVTEDGVIQLIADDFVDLAYKKEELAKHDLLLENANVPSLPERWSNVYTNINRDTLMNYLIEPSNWSEFAVEGKTTAVGGPNIEEFCSSYKLTHPDDYIEQKYIEKNVKYHQFTEPSAVPGNVIRFIKRRSSSLDTEYSSAKNIETTNELYVTPKTSTYTKATKKFWICSFGVYHESYIFSVRESGRIGGEYYANTDVGVRPLVSLYNAKIVNIDGNLTVQY